ncbi:hypothetical protein F5Y17DRAFT_329693 [Xylariaceae sp. FL0594]|nr:hypothetical protein F5Y17DRAFT_329693 [Xylariaceae sp. FL0594]
MLALSPNTCLQAEAQLWANLSLGANEKCLDNQIHSLAFKPDARKPWACPVPPRPDTPNLPRPGPLVPIPSVPTPPPSPRRRAWNARRELLSTRARRIGADPLVCPYPQPPPSPGPRRPGPLNPPPNVPSPPPSPPPSRSIVGYDDGLPYDPSLVALFVTGLYLVTCAERLLEACLPQSVMSHL